MSQATEGFDKNLRTWYSQCARFGIKSFMEAIKAQFSTLPAQEVEEKCNTMKALFTEAVKKFGEYIEIYSKTFSAAPEDTLEDWRTALKENWDSIVSFSVKNETNNWLLNTAVKVCQGDEEDASISFKGLYVPIHFTSAHFRRIFKTKYGFDIVTAPVEKFQKLKSDEEAVRLKNLALASHKSVYLIYNCLYYVAPEEKREQMLNSINEISDLMGYDRHIKSKEEIQKKSLEEAKKIVEGALDMAAATAGGGEAGEGMKNMLGTILGKTGFNKMIELGDKASGPAEFQKLFSESIQKDESLMKTLEKQAEEIELKRKIALEKEEAEKHGITIEELKEKQQKAIEEQKKEEKVVKVAVKMSGQKKGKAQETSKILSVEEVKEEHPGVQQLSELKALVLTEEAQNQSVAKECKADVGAGTGLELCHEVVE